MLILLHIFAAFFAVSAAVVWLSSVASFCLIAIIGIDRPAPLSFVDRTEDP